MEMKSDDRTKIDISEYKIILPKELIELINDPKEHSRAEFENTEQIITIFQDLEEKNLNLIRVSQVVINMTSRIWRKEMIP
jgi:hypothetical protein